MPDPNQPPPQTKTQEEHDPEQLGFPWENSEQTARYREDIPSPQFSLTTPSSYGVPLSGPHDQDDWGDPSTWETLEENLDRVEGE